MCEFLSIVSDGRGEIRYCDWEMRKKIMSGELRDKAGNRYFSADSHSSICDIFKIKDEEWNKYEYNPITRKFTVDMINTFDDSTEVEKKVRALDFKTIVELLIIKPIVHPFRDVEMVKEVTEEHIKLLKEWDSVWGSVGRSVWDSVGYSVRDSVGYSVWNSVGDSVRESVWESVGDSVWESVWESVRDSVGDSIYGYISSFFNLEEWRYIEHEPYKNPFQSAVDLWEMGLVPSFDGDSWRLHSGQDAEVIFEISKEELEKR